MGQSSARWNMRWCAIDNVVLVIINVIEPVNGIKTHRTDSVFGLSVYLGSFHTTCFYMLRSQVTHSLCHVLTTLMKRSCQDASLYYSIE